MYIGEPPKTQADLNFELAGIPIRISVSFWVAAAVLGWNPITNSQNGPRNLLLWIVAVFSSILIHELGHSVAHRMYGMGSRIVLYYLGGLAIPSSFSRYVNSKQQIIISAAGPAAQLGLALLVMSLIAVSGKQIPIGGFVADLLRIPIDMPEIDNELARNFCSFILYVSVYWALLNLLPIYPMDGGRISRELFVLSQSREAIQQSLIVSIVTAAAAAIYSIRMDQSFMSIFFGAMAYENYLALRGYTGGGYGRQPW